MLANGKPGQVPGGFFVHFTPPFTIAHFGQCLMEIIVYLSVFVFFFANQSKPSWEN